MHFGEDGAGGFGGVGGLGDGAANDEHGGSGLDGLARGCDSALISDGRTGGADAGDDEARGWAKLQADCGDFFGGADEAVDAAGSGEVGEAKDLGGGRVGDADSVELGGVHAGEDGHGEESGAVRVFGGGFGGCAEHGFASEGV